MDSGDNKSTPSLADSVKAVTHHINSKLHEQAKKFIGVFKNTDMYTTSTRMMTTCTKETLTASCHMYLVMTTVKRTQFEITIECAIVSVEPTLYNKRWAICCKDKFLVLNLAVSCYRYYFTN